LLTMIMATETDLERIAQLYRDCTADLNRRGIFQWNERYPNEGTAADGIANNCLYRFEDDGVLVGTVILNELESPEWESMPWHLTEGKFLIVHALALSPAFQGKGYGQQALALCEEFGIRNGYASIRLDVFPENPVAVRLYERNGFQKVGEITLDFKPEWHKQYWCYEKGLKG
jgi:RimJ/RimL family protein N-acetyltransferase